MGAGNSHDRETGDDSGDADGPRQFVLEYHQALQEEEPLAPYFSPAETTVKFGISETLRGGEAVADGLTAQTATTTGWVVDSRDLVVDRRGDVAWFADDVFMAWSDTEQRIRYEFDTRWSGTLERADGWQFVGMHVSTSGDI